MKYNVKDLLNKRRYNCTLVPMNGIDRLLSKVKCRCTKCGTTYTMTGASFLNKRTCNNCVVQARFDKFKRKFYENHKDNFFDYKIIGYTGDCHHIIIQHHTNWCNRVYTIESRHPDTNCYDCYMGSGMDRNKEAQRKIENPHIKIIKYVHRSKGVSLFYCDWCQREFPAAYRKDIQCYYCTKKLQYIKKLLTHKTEMSSNEQLNTTRLIRYNNWCKDGYKVVKVKKNYYLIHTCLDGHYRAKKIPKNNDKKKIIRRYTCSICQGISNRRKLQDKLDSLNIPYQIIPLFAGINHLCVLFNTKDHFYLVYKNWRNVVHNPQQLNKPRIGNVHGILNGYFQRRIDEMYGENEFIVKNSNKDTLTLYHKKCKRTYDYKIDSLLSFDIRCKYCRRPIGEQTIIHYLESKGIKYESPAIIGAKNVFDLHYDFYLPEYQLLIEYDGAQHRVPIKNFDGEEGYLKQHHRDLVKDKYVKDSNLRLLRINSDNNRGIKKIGKDIHEVLCTLNNNPDIFGKIFRC